MAVGLLSKVRGDIEGIMVFIINQSDVTRLLGVLGAKRVDDSIELLGPFEKSMIEETANITISSFMNSLASHLDLKCVPNAPIYL